MNQIRYISGLLTADTNFEKHVSEMITSDMKDHVDVAKFGNKKYTSI